MSYYRNKYQVHLRTYMILDFIARYELYQVPGIHVFLHYKLAYNTALPHK